jgi:O-antigen/teichoic acid export membrane protein
LNQPQHPFDSKRVYRNVAWSGLNNTIVSALDILGTILVLRFWISVEEYGILSLAMTLAPMLDLATDMGLSSAVIQRDDSDENKISTVFWLNVAMSLFLFGVLLVGAPILAHFQGHPVIASLLIAYGGKLVFQNFYNIPSAMMKRQLRFRELAQIRITANIVEFVCKIGLAAAGFSIWCYVLSRLANVLVTGVGTQLRNPWRPRFVFRLREAAAHVRFGLKTSASGVLFHFYTNVDYQIVGYFFGAHANGFYRAAYELVLEPVRIISNVISEVAFPVFSRLRENRQALIDQFVAFTRQNLIVILPFLVLVLLCPEAMIRVFLGGERWVAAAPAARILCAVGVLRALSFVVPPLLDGMGRPSLTLIYTSVAAVVIPTTFVLSAWFFGERLNYLSVAVAWAVGYPIAFAVLAFLALRVLEVSTMAYLRRVIGIPLCVGAAFLAGFAARSISAGLPSILQLSVVAATLVLVLGLLLSRFEGISPRTIFGHLHVSKPATHGSPPGEVPS